MTFLEALKDYKYIFHPDLDFIISKQNNVYVQNPNPKDVYISVSYLKVELIFSDEWIGFNQEIYDEYVGDATLTFRQVTDLMNKMSHNKQFNNVLLDKKEEPKPIKNKKSKKKAKKQKKYTLKGGLNAFGTIPGGINNNIKFGNRGFR